MFEGNDNQIEPTDVKSMVVRGSELKIQIAAMTEELHSVNMALAKVATFLPNSKTGHLMEAGIRVKVSLRENVKYLQDRLQQVKDLIPESFNRVFVYEYKPVSTKELTAAMAENDEFAKAVEWSREIKPGMPTVTYERIDMDEIPF